MNGYMISQAVGREYTIGQLVGLTHELAVVVSVYSPAFRFSIFLKQDSSRRQRFGIVDHRNIFRAVDMPD